MARCEKSLSEEASGSSTWQRVSTLGLLTLCYTLGELGHFLIATTSKQVANSLQFGDLRYGSATFGKRAVIVLFF